VHEHDRETHEHHHGEHRHHNGEHGHHEGEHRHGGHGDHEHGHEHEHHHHHAEGGERIGFTGKVHGLIYDRQGDFDGFLLDTEDGERAFGSREPAMEQVIGRAWSERTLTTVFVEEDEPWRPVRVVLRA
jgi:hypothetical protein